MPHRYFTTRVTDTHAYLDSADAKHFCVVMRAKPGEEAVLCDGAGTDYLCRAVRCAPDLCELEILSSEKSVSEPSVAVTLYVGYPKADKLEWIIQKGVELGAVRIVPFFSRYCVVTPKKEEQKNERYQRIALEAAKQAGRGIIPKVEMPLSFAQMLQEAAQHDEALFLYEKGGQPLHSRLQNTPKRVAIITGSEGGFSEEEANAAHRAGCVPIGLGARILRCETAPVAALSVVMAQTGNLQ